MAYSFVQYESAGEATYTVTFPYLSTSHVTVSVGGVSVAFTWDSATVVRPTVTPSSGDVVEIRRSSSRSTRLGDYSDASILTEAALDADALQMFYVAQEAFDAADNAIQLISDSTYDADNKRISNLADAVAAGDAVNKSQLDAAALSPVTPTAGSIANIPSGNLAATDLQTAVDELQDDIDTINTGTVMKHSLVDAKGDLLVATAADTVARMAAGADGKVLVTNSGETSGLQWSPYGIRRLVGARAFNNTSTPNSQVDMSASALHLQDSSGGVLVVQAPSTKTCNLSTSGPAAGGRDQSGAFSSSSWVHFFWIGKLDGTYDVIASTADQTTGPTLPSGYTLWAYSHAQRIDGSGNLLKIQMYGRRVWYTGVQTSVVTLGQATTETAIDCSTYVPSNALEFIIEQRGYVRQAATANVVVYLRIVSGSNWSEHTGYLHITSADVTEDTFGNQVAMPNLGQQYYYLWSGAYTGRVYTANVQGYIVPNSGD